MKKRGILLVAIILLLPLVLAGSVDDEIKKLTYYAEEYETGNINYVQLVTYTSSIRENLNELLGVSNKEDGGILKQEQIKEVLGEPSGYTDWVWVEGEEQEKRMDEEVPYWEKIVFDGKKLQIRLNSYPSIFKKKDSEGKENQKPSENEGKLIYRLNFYTQFKKPKEELNIQGRVEEVKKLAETFNADPSQDNAEALAKASVNIEKSFESYFRQSGQNCEDVMNSLFGAENKREEQKLIVNEIDFYKGDDFDARARLEMCDDCSNHYVGMDIWLDTRGKIKMPEEKPQENGEKPALIGFEEFKTQIQQVLENLKSALDNKDFEEYSRERTKLRNLNEGWNQASNDVWKQLDEEYKKKGETLGKDNPDPYWWVALEKEKRAKAKEIQDANYQKTKEFFSQLFSDYEKKEYFFQQAQWEKRLIEEFTEAGEEICDNNQDDNGNGQIDCQEDQCGGKICGWGEAEQAEQVKAIEQVEEVPIAPQVEQVERVETEVANAAGGGGGGNVSVVSSITGNVIEETEVENVTETETTPVNVTESTPVNVTETTTATASAESSQATPQAAPVKKKVQLYCISQECKPKDDSYKKEQPVCGNHLCEAGEKCPEDCASCQAYEAIPCSGKVIFSGEDEKGCPLKPVCIEEKACEKSEDCPQPLCGKAECVMENGIGICKTAGLEECKEAECVEGEEKTQLCGNNEKRIIKICQEGKWINTGVSECEAVKEELKEDKSVGNECSVKEDCGNTDDVCSNGRCITLPKTEEVEKEESEEQVEQQEKAEESEQPEEQQEETKEEPADNNQLTAAAVTGHQTEEPVVQEAEPATQQPQEQPAVQEPQPPQENQPEQPATEQPTQPGEQQMPKEQPYQESPQPEQRQEYNPEEDRQRRIQNCKENSERECANRYVMDCVGQCVFKDNQEQDLEACKKNCAEEHAQEIKDCVSKCSDTCETQDWCQIDWPQGNKQEKGVFNFGGTCRTSQQKTESFIYFNGWGDPFDRIQSLKNKYYEGGESDWCKSEFESLIKERKEIEKSLNQEYAAWFFEKYLANSAEDWEQHVSGIYELYWRIVENQRQMVKMTECTGKTELPQFNLINISYNTEYGSLELWEERKTARLPELSEKEVEIVSPYMKLWIFPPREFLVYEMKKAMENGEFPGSPEEKMERKNEGGLKEEEKDKIRNNAKFMKTIKKLADSHGGSYDGVVQIKDYQTGEIIFNLFVKVNEQDILSMEPMLPEKTPETDLSITLDFDKIYELVSTQEKDMKKEQIQMPPWEKEKVEPVRQIKEAVNGIKMFFKVRDLINSAEYEPKEGKKEVKSLVNGFMRMMMETNEGPKEEQLTDEEKQQAEEIKDELLNSKEAMTGEIIMSF